jgi:hypothetical protein
MLFVVQLLLSVACDCFSLLLLGFENNELCGSSPKQAETNLVPVGILSTVFTPSPFCRLLFEPEVLRHLARLKSSQVNMILSLDWFLRRSPVSFMRRDLMQ